MRHFGSLILAAIFGPAAFLLTGTGLSAFASARTDNFIDDPLGTLAALGALLLAGVLYGILVMVRLSPVGPGLAGLALMGSSAFALAAPQTYDKALAGLGVHMGGAVGQWGLGILLGVPLVATLTSPRRWRREAPGYPPAGYPPGGYAPAGHPPAGYPPGYPGQQPARPSIPDETKQMPKQPEYMTLPDIAPPSLRYPGVPPGAPPPAPQNLARPAISPLSDGAPPPVASGAPPPPPLATAKPSVAPGAPPPPPLAAAKPSAAPGAPPPPPLSSATPSAAPPAPLAPGAPPPPPLATAKPSVAPGAPPPPPQATAKPSAAPPSAPPPSAPPPPPPRTSGAPAAPSATPAAPRVSPRVSLSGTGSPAAAAPPAQPRLADSAISGAAEALPKRVPSPPPDGFSAPGAEDATVKISTEDDDQTKRLS